MHLEGAALMGRDSKLGMGNDPSMQPKPTGNSGGESAVNKAGQRVQEEMANLWAEGKLRPECYLDPKTGKPR
jgi:hypothetical protein